MDAFGFGAGPSSVAIYGSGTRVVPPLVPRRLLRGAQRGVFEEDGVALGGEAFERLNVHVGAWRYERRAFIDHESRIANRISASPALRALFVHGRASVRYSPLEIAIARSLACRSMAGFGAWCSESVSPRESRNALAVRFNAEMSPYVTDAGSPERTRWFAEACVIVPDVRTGPRRVSNTKLFFCALTIPTVSPNLDAMKQDKQNVALPKPLVELLRISAATKRVRLGVYVAEVLEKHEAKRHPKHVFGKAVA